MRLLVLLLLCFVVSPLHAQTEKDRRNELHKYLLGETTKHFDARRAEIAKLKTPDDIRKRQAELKAKFITALGGFPDKTPLNAKVVGTLQADGFRVEKVIYESRPDHHVTANFYLPAGKGPFPGVLVPCGHSDNGKAADAYQRACILMARNGLAVLCYDPIGQGERFQLLSDKLKPSIAGLTSEHTMVGVGALLVGQSTASYRVWDGIRSLDYLASRPEIDAKKLGCTGNSGGGTLTAYLMALDDRIFCAVPSCYITSLERLFATIGPQDAEQNIPGQVAFGMEHSDFVTMRAPRPTLIATATQDFFDIAGSWTSFREASLVYSKLGHGERVALFEYDDKHGFSKPRREAATRWLRRWLLGIDDAVVEAETKVFSDADLRCTRTGQVLEDFRGKSAFHLNRDYAASFADTRAKFATLPAAQREQEIRRLLALPENRSLFGRSKVEDLGDITRELLHTESRLKLPLMTNQKSRRESEYTIYLTDRDLLDEARPGEALAELVKAGGNFHALSVRGFGEVAAVPYSAKPGYFGGDFKNFFLSLHLNRPLLGQRVSDVLALGIDTRADIHVVGVGTAGPVALHFAALEPRVKSLTLIESVVSWRNVVETPISLNQLTNVVPGVLRVYDLPDLAATIAPQALTIREPVNAALQPLSQKELDEAYAGCRQHFEKAGAAAKLELRAKR